MEDGQRSSRNKGDAVLYQNETKTVTLIDLPRSISQAQSLALGNSASLLSCTPLQQPFPLTEPKTEAARAQVTSRTTATANTKIYNDLISAGLQEIRQQHRGDWCLPRHISSIVPYRQTMTASADSVREQALALEPHLQPPRGTPRRSNMPTLILPRNQYTVASHVTLSNRLVHNPQSGAVHLQLTESQAGYRIPPLSTFFLSEIGKQTVWAWSAAILSLFPTPSSTAGPGQFDFILLDPPWENKSAGRSHMYSNSRQDGPMDFLQEVLGRHVAPSGLVACWVTNSAKARSSALDAFHAWGVELMEEWLWLKVTVDGEPVYPVDGLWRKPYEVLLLGREIGSYQQSVSDTVAEDSHVVKRRFIVAVPDLHSRKPCVKALIEPLLTERKDYRALEVFARNLTSGWCSWGNEVLKFNWEGHWVVEELLCESEAESKGKNPETASSDPG